MSRVSAAASLEWSALLACASLSRCAGRGAIWSSISARVSSPGTSMVARSAWLGLGLGLRVRLRLRVRVEA